MPPKIETAAIPQKTQSARGERGPGLNLPGKNRPKESQFISGARYTEPSHAQRQVGATIGEKPVAKVGSSVIGDETPLTVQGGDGASLLGDITITSFHKEPPADSYASQRQTECYSNWCPTCINCSVGKRCG